MQDPDQGQTVAHDLPRPPSSSGTLLVNEPPALPITSAGRPEDTVVAGDMPEGTLQVGREGSKGEDFLAALRSNAGDPAKSGSSGLVPCHAQIQESFGLFGLNHVQSGCVI